MAILFGCAYVYMELQLPNVEVLKDVHMKVPLKIYTRDGKMIAQYGSMRRIPVTLDQVPPLLVKAVLAVEDARYYSHPGVDFIGLMRAAKAVISSGRKVQGASTITMQVARNFFLTRKKTYGRKIKEILLALKIDKELSKNKVLELYLNKVYFGKRAYGVAAAAKVYYGKTLDQLTLPQMAMIAGLPQAPSANNPLNNPARALNRRNHVLRRMLEVGFLDQTSYQQAVQTPLTATYHGERVQVQAPYLAEMVRQVIMSEYGNNAYDLGLSVVTTVSSQLQQVADTAVKKGLIAYTERHGYYKPEMNLPLPANQDFSSWQTVLTKLNKISTLQVAAVKQVDDQSVQAMLADGTTVTVPWSGLSWARPALTDGTVGAAPKTASDILHQGDVIWLRVDRNGLWRLTQIPLLQGAMVAMNPQNGAVEALIGGFDYQLSKFNRATQAQRQPGSNFKPFIYSAALAQGYTLASMINDAPIVMQDTGENTLWRPRNDTLKFYGPTPLKVGLTKSRNLVSIRLLQSIGLPYALDYVSRFGFDPKQLPHSLSLALGSGMVTPMQIATGYSVFANGGYRVTPYFIDQIVGENQQVLFQANPARACEACITNEKPDASVLPNPMAPRVLTPQNAYLMNNALEGVIQTGTGRAAKVLRRTDLAGKTGTTNNQVDAWFTGYNQNMLASVWVGFDGLNSIHEYGARAALPIWIAFMRQALRGQPHASMPQPPGIVTARIDPADGLLANPGQPGAIFEVFRRQNLPSQFSPTTVTHVSTTGVSTNSAVTPSGQSDSSEPLF